MQVQEARTAAEKAQQLQQTVANRKRNKQLEIGGLVITRALYGNHVVLNRINTSSGTSNESTSEVIDVTIPLNFLVSDSGQLKVCSIFFVPLIVLTSYSTGPLVSYEYIEFFITVLSTASISSWTKPMLH